MAEEPRQPHESPQETAPSADADARAKQGAGGATVDAQPSGFQGASLVDAAEPGAPIPADAVDPDLLRLSVPIPRRHPGVALAVLIVCGLLLFRLRTELRYALQSNEPQDLGRVGLALNGAQLAGSVDRYVALAGIPDHRNALAFDPKGGRPRQHVFRLLGTTSRVFVTAQAAGQAPYRDGWHGRLRRFDELSFFDTVRMAWAATQVSRAVDLGKLRQMAPGALPVPLSTTDRAGEPMTVGGQQDLLVDVLFPDDVRVLLSKEKVPSLPDADHEIERFGLPHGPGVETKDGYGYVLRLPSQGPERQRVLAHIDALGVWLWHRVETYRVPAGAVQVTPAGLMLPGPDALPQPVRYRVPAEPPAIEGAKPPAAAQAPALLLPQKEPSTLILWEQLEAVQIHEPMNVAADALVLVHGETPKSVFWTLPMAALLVICALFNLWYLVRALRRASGSDEATAA